MTRRERAWRDNGVVTRAEWASVLDCELLAIRDRQAQRLHAEHVRRDRETRAAADAAIVANRELMVAAHRRVRELIEP